MYLTIQWLQLHFCILCISLHLGCDPHVHKNSGKKEKNASTGAGVFKSRHILLHKYVNRIMISYLWRQIQLIIPSCRFRSIECRHFDLFWKYVTWSLFPLKKYSRIELCMVDKGFGGRQYQKTTLASNPKRDYIRDVCMRDHMPQARKARSYFYTKRLIQMILLNHTPQDDTDDST
jgi:hypothetical protein